MKEVEVKILEINREKIVKILSESGALKVFDSDILTIFLDFPDNQIHKRRDVLRLRKEGDKSELTYKKIEENQAVKQAQEYAVEISDIETTQTILQNLGLGVTQKMNKHRLSYKIGSVRFDIDRYTGEFGFIPEFLEIEGPEDGIKKYAKLLGFQGRDCLPWSTDELIRHYQSKKS
ncbi:MAG: class IV adenylate cyclase [Candidatus Bathyarchaeia archaeon]|jgi:predicted adenylyl cyclase CyaB